MSKTKSITVLWNKLDFQKVVLGLEKKNTKVYYKTANETDTEPELQNESKLEFNLQPLNIQLPFMYLPFACSENKTRAKWSNFKEYQIDCSVYQADDRKPFADFISRFTNHLVQLINESDNFDQPCSVQNLRSLTWEKPPYQPTLRININKNTDGVFLPVLWKKTDDKPLKLKLSDSTITQHLKQKAVFKPSISCEKIYFYKEFYGIGWNLDQVMLYDNPPKSQFKTVEPVASSEPLKKMGYMF